MNTVKLFISHSWTYNTQYLNFIRMLNGRGHFSFQNYSVPIDDPIHTAANAAQLKEAIAQQMRPAQVIVILAGVYSTHSKWINTEIDIAVGWGKPIIGVVHYGAERASSVVQKHATRMVNWNADSVVSAIREVI